MRERERRKGREGERESKGMLGLWGWAATSVTLLCCATADAIVVFADAKRKWHFASVAKVAAVTPTATLTVTPTATPTVTATVTASKRIENRNF